MEQEYEQEKQEEDHQPQDDSEGRRTSFSTPI
jgi:hypothetical protein